MSRSYVFFNYTCLAFIAFFLFGTLFVWRGSFSVATNVSKEILEVPLREIEDLRLQISDSENIVDSEVDEAVIEDSITKVENESGTKIIQNIPKSINLPVPFTSQAPEKNWDQPWQDACEEAAVLMLDAYYKGYDLSPLFVRDEILKMVSWEEELGWENSISIKKVKKLTEEFQVSGFKFQIIENPTIKQIKESVAKGHPVLAVAYGKDLPNPYFRNGGPEYHALIIRGYTEDSFITNDPGTQFGENFVYKYEELMNAVRDWNDGDVENGQRVVMVLK